MDFGDHFDGQHELQDVPVISEYGDVFEAFGRAVTSQRRCSYDRVGVKENTGFTSSIPISASRDG